MRSSRPLAGDKSVDAKGAEKGKKERKGIRDEKPDLLLLFFASFFSLCDLCVERPNSRPKAGIKSIDAEDAEKNKKGRKGIRNEKPDSLLLSFASFLCDLCVERPNSRPLAGIKSVDAENAEKNKKGRKRIRNKNPVSLLFFFASNALISRGNWQTAADSPSRSSSSS